MTLPLFVSRDPVMTAVASVAILTVMLVGIYVTWAMRPYAQPPLPATVDCNRILNMIDDAFADRRMSDAETRAIEDASRAMRDSATPANAKAVAKCVGLPRNAIAA